MKTYIRTLKFYKKYPVGVFLLIVSSILGGIYLLVNPIFFKELIDALMNIDENPEQIWNTVYLWLFINLIGILNIIFLTYYNDVLSHRIYKRVNLDLVEHLLTLSVGFHQSKKSGETVRKMDRGADSVFGVTVDCFRGVFQNFVALVLLVPVCFYFHFQMALAMMFIVPFVVAVSVWISMRTRKAQMVVDKYYNKFGGVSYDTVGNITVVKGFNILKSKMREMEGLLKIAHDSQIKVLPWWTALIVAGRFATILATLIVFVLGIHFYFLGQITIGEIVMFLGFSASIFSIVGILIDMFSRYTRERERLNYMYEVWDEKPNVVDCPRAKKLENVVGGVEFRGITFAYGNGKNVLKDISFVAKPGETVALVGHTGSGKSTTMNLLVRFFDAQKGQVLIDGQDISKVTQESLRENIGIVFQDNMLFHDSIENNLRVGKPNATKKEIEAALKKSYALKFINATEKGLETKVGERGVRFSGGEKQRLAIARALLKDAPILILDEATSALDAQTENYVQKATENLKKNRTTFIVAHRLSTIKNADKILVFDNGRIVECGKYKTLMQKDGKFAKLVHAQTSQSKDSSII